MGKRDHLKAMRSLVKKVLLILLISSVVGCGTINYRDRIVLPAQDIGIDEPHGKTRIIIFNETEPSWKTNATAGMNFEINGKYATAISASHYLQLFLEPGDYLIKLEHIDILTFTDNFQLNVGNDPLYVKITRQAFSNKLDIVKELPLGFSNNYKAAAP